MTILTDPKKQFLIALAVSFGMHLIVLPLLPGLNFGDFANKPTYTEIKLIYIPPPSVKVVKKTKKKVKPKTTVPENGNILTEQIDKLSKNTQFQGNIPAVELPVEIENTELGGLLPPVEFPMEDIILPAGTPISAVPEPKSEPTPFSSVNKIGSDYEKNDSPVNIEWEGRPRRTVFQPSIPKYSSRIEGNVRLKFWVDPSGKVSNVIVLQKLDAHLERISLGYMKQWVFEPLAPNVKQVLQWGTVTIKFRRD